MTERSDMRDGREWAQRLLGKPIDQATEDQRRAEIRADAEAEVDGEIDAIRARREREEGQRMAEHNLRHRRAVDKPRDPRPEDPIGTERRAGDGTVWVRKS
jgi:hypothetical protein